MKRLLPALLLFIAAAAPQEAERVSVHFNVDATPAAEGKVKITMTVTGAKSDPLGVAIPVWAPGAYRYANYYRFVSDFAAHAGDEKLDIEHPDNSTWNVKTGGASPVTITYTIAIPDSGRGGISKDHCDLQGPDTFMYLVKHKDAAHSSTYTLPEGWKVGTGLEKKDDKYYARDYDTFIDCPTELGKFDLHTYEVHGVKYEIVVHSKDDYDDKGLVELCRKVTEEQHRMMGGVPFKRYVWIYHFRDFMGGGGLEHLNSTTISIPYMAIRRNVGVAAGVTSHEFFHLWNVKRLRPKVLGPFDYSRDVRTRSLWMCEGVTSYYGDLALQRSGVWSRDQYLTSLRREIESLQNNPDHLQTSVEKASWTVWDQRSGPKISYYNKGLLLGLLLDLKIRKLTENKKNFDDVIRFLYDKYVVKGGGPIGVGYEEKDLEAVISSVSGHDFSDFFKKYMAGVEELPYEEVLPYAGIKVDLQVSESPNLGVYTRGRRVVAPYPGAKTEFKTGDTIKKINDTDIRRSNFRGTVRELEIGADVTVVVSRGGEDVTIKMKVLKSTRTRCSLSWDEEAGELEMKIRESWLKGSDG